MELVKNIFFNTDKLIENTKIKISYIGKFFGENDEQVFLHYGFGDNWENCSDIKMEKTELGFQAEIELPSCDSLNLCFKNSNNVWDNNNGNDYKFLIEKAPVSLIAIDNEKSLNTHRRIHRIYILSKKVKLAIYKIINYLPKLISGNYKRKTSEN